MCAYVSHVLPESVAGTIANCLQLGGRWVFPPRCSYKCNLSICTSPLFPLDTTASILFSYIPVASLGIRFFVQGSSYVFSLFFFFLIFKDFPIGERSYPCPRPPDAAAATATTATNILFAICFPEWNPIFTRNIATQSFHILPHYSNFFISWFPWWTARIPIETHFLKIST